MKRIAAILCLLLALTMLCGCGPFTCAGCQREVHGKRHVLEVAGEEFPLCKDCYREYAEKKETLDDAVKGGYGDLTAVP